MNTKKLARLLREEGLSKKSYMPDFYDYSADWEDSMEAEIPLGVNYRGREYRSVRIYISNDSVQLELYGRPRQQGRSAILESPNDGISERGAQRVMQKMVLFMEAQGEVPDGVG